MDYHNLEDDQITGQPPIAEDEASSLEEPRRRPPGLILILVTLLVVLAMLATLIGPMLRAGPRRQPTPTPTLIHLRTV